MQATEKAPRRVYEKPQVVSFSEAELLASIEAQGASGGQSQFGDPNEPDAP